jgi:hypothetical protein
VSAAFPLSPLVKLDAPSTSVGATLATPLTYDVIAPVSNVLDALTLLTPSQYWATFSLYGLLFLGVCWFTGSRQASLANATKLARASLQFVAGAIAVVGAMLVLTRPMASLRLDDPDLLAADFHSHTSSSHDGRSGFDAEKNRTWHRAAGFDVAYVTDHRTFDAAIDAGLRNPSAAGEGVVLLPGVELHDRGEHPLLLGADPRRTKITSADIAGADIAPMSASVPPILILSLPGSVDHVPQNEYTGSVRLAAIETSDGCPRGLAQSERDREGIAKLSTALHLTRVSGSDNHGWGRTAPAWTVLRIKGWRMMTPGNLDAAIRSALIANTAGFSEVIARRTALIGQGPVAQALSGVGVAVLLLRTMNVRERFSWAAWGWLFGLASLTRARRNRRGLRLLVSAKRKLGSRPRLVEAAALEAAS